MTNGCEEVAIRFYCIFLVLFYMILNLLKLTLIVHLLCVRLQNVLPVLSHLMLTALLGGRYFADEETEASMRSITLSRSPLLATGELCSLPSETIPGSFVYVFLQPLGGL